MIIGTLGANAISQIAGALGSDGTSTAQPSGFASASATAATQSLTAPQPPSGESAISQTATKFITELKSLLLSFQTSQPQTSSGTAAASGPAQQDPAAAPSDAAQSTPHHHHHHHVETATDTAAASIATASAAPAASGQASSSQASTDPLARLAQALTAYANNLAGNAASRPQTSLTS